jgi:16S rRNA (guanine966-N2)-methyltransferase
MRVISGVVKGRRLKAPFGTSLLRPTSDKVKEAVFDIIGPGIEDARFLDLFCGTGAVGIEALSRGSRNVVFVDSKSSAIDLLKDNLFRCGFDNNFEIIQCDALQALATLSNRQRKFEYIFLDPPYGSDLILNSMDAISAGHLLLPNARILVEHASKKPVPEKVEGFLMDKEYKFGETMITLFHSMEI